MTVLTLLFPPALYAAWFRVPRLSAADPANPPKDEAAAAAGEPARRIESRRPMLDDDMAPERI